MTKQRKVILLLVILLTVCMGGFLAYQSRFAEVGGKRYDKSIESIDLSGASVGDLSQLRPFTKLKQIDLRGSGLTCRQYDELKAQFPETEILWDIPFQGACLDMNTQELALDRLSQEDMAVIPYFVRLKTISAGNCPDYVNLHALRLQRPDLEFHYQIPLAGGSYRYDVSELVIPGDNVAEMMEMLPLFSQLKTVQLQAPLAPVDQILALREAFPEITFSWNLELGGISVDEFTETLDLTGIPMTVEEMEAALPYLLNLTCVDMTDCGISNEEMDALNRRHENVKIVWTVDLGEYFRIRTDATYFMPAKEGIFVSDNSLYNLRYCTDIIAIDLGHKRISNIEFVAFMPHLKYLLLGETHVRDLTPVTGLTELVYLELFLTQTNDLSPLLTLTALEDLNLHYTTGDVNMIAQMTWLKNLWWGNNVGSRLTWEQQEMLRQAIPGCNFNFTSPSSTGGGWRELPNYYAQRDVFGMYYMTG